MLAKEINNIIRRTREYAKLLPKPTRSTIKAGIDTLSTNLDEDKDMLITSPPYLQAQEYIRQAKMDLFWLGYPEAKVKQLSKRELPYSDVMPCPINSDAYHQWRERIEGPHFKRVFDRYFWGVLGALTRLQQNVRSYLFLFVGPATIRTHPVPIDHIFVEHFTSLGWIHESTLKDTIVSRRMFFYRSNPATGLNDQRMRTESLVVLHRMIKRKFL